MTWLVWRRQRSALLLAAALLAITVIALVVARLLVEGRATDLGAAGCLTVPGSDCAHGGAGDRELYSTFFMFNRLIRFWLWILAPLLGLIVAATLFARETEQGTVVFALTQSTSRRRWWSFGILATLLPALGGVAVLTVVATWALGPFAVLYGNNWMEPLDFDFRGIWPLASALIAFGFAALFGTLARSSLAVVVATIVAWVAISAPLLYTRYEYLPYATASQPVAETAGWIPVDGMPRGALYLDGNGNELDQATIVASCQADVSYVACLQRGGVTTFAQQYQPSTNFWPLQGILAAVAVGIAVVLLGASALRAQRLG